MNKKIKNSIALLSKLKFFFISLTSFFLSFYLKDKLFLVLAVLFLGMFFTEFFFQKDKKIHFSFSKPHKKKLHENKTTSSPKKLLPVTLLPLIFSLVFFTALLMLKASYIEGNIFVNYLQAIRKSLLSNYFHIGLFLIFLVADTITSLKVFKIDLKKHAISSLVGYLLGFSLSLPLIFLVGFLNLNIFSYSFKLHTFEMSDPDQIVQTLSNTETAPQIVNISGKSFERAVFEKKGNSFSEFYNSRIITSVPIAFQTKIEKSADTFLFDGNLYFTKINQDSIEKIAPIVSKKYVEASLDGKYVKDVPNIDVIGRQEYLKYREEKINEQIDKIKSIYDEVTKYLQSLYGEIANANSKIQANENIISSAISTRDSNYNSCKTAGYYSFYFDPGFHRYYTDAQCEAQKASWDSTIAQGQQNISEWQSYKSKVNADIATYKDVQENLSYYIDLVEAQKSTTVYELGLFEPEKDIKVVLDTTNSNALADFFATSVHEYFHYTSYISEEKVLPSFFEESLTEYFARESIKQILDINIHQGYPAYIDLISKMIDDIGEEQMRDIYLTKNFDLLVGKLNEKYGESFYEDTKYYFDVLPYLDTESQVKIVNDIMFRIGGEKVDLEKVVSTESEI